MSIKAHIVREDVIYVDENKNVYERAPEGIPVKEYIHKDQEECFSLWSQTHLKKLILDYGGDDYSNYEGLGEIQIGLDDFDALYENESFEGRDLDSIEMMRKYFDEGEYILVLNCW